MTEGNIDDFNPSDEKDVNFLRNNLEIIKNSIDKINLKLDGLTILTEAATGNWVFTPFIAGMAKAKNVICFTKDSKYGKAEKIIENFENISKFFDLKNSIIVHDKLTKELIQQADLITNSGFLRPINKKFIDSMKKTAVISLMWEPWEYRERDLDLTYCWNNGISVLGVNEDNNLLNIMKYTGKNLLKILNDNHFSLKGKNVILVGENKSVNYMLKPIIESGASSLSLVSSFLSGVMKDLAVKVIGKDLEENQVEPFLKKCDVLIINSAPRTKKIIGDEGLSVSKLKLLCPNVTVFNYFGLVDHKKLMAEKVICYPTNEPDEGHMGWTLDNLGSNPAIELNALGLKVGEILASNRREGLDPQKSEEKALQSQFCKGFSTEQQKKYHYPKFR